MQASVKSQTQFVESSSGFFKSLNICLSYLGLHLLEVILHTLQILLLRRRRLYHRLIDVCMEYVVYIGVCEHTGAEGNVSKIMHSKMGSLCNVEFYCYEVKIHKF